VQELLGVAGVIGLCEQEYVARLEVGQTVSAATRGCRKRCGAKWRPGQTARLQDILGKL